MSSMRHGTVAGLLLLMLGTAIGPRVAAAQPVTDAEVRQAIRRGIDFLYDQQEPWGHWDDQQPPANPDHQGKQWGGWTALATYALLAAGEDWQQNPKLLEPLKFLAEIDIDGTYAVGLRAHIWPKLPDASSEILFLDELKEDLYLLVQGISPQTNGYRYSLGEDRYDLSCTQYGALGVWEAAKRGLPVDDRYWRTLEEKMMETQNPDGGWGYTPGGESTLSMTAAGLAIMYILQDHLHARDFQRPGIAANHPVHQRIERGLDYFDRHFRPSANGYTMVGVERVGVASGRKFFNQQDWYRAGARRFLDSQDADGAMGRGGNGGTDLVNTSFALVFLSRGRVPVFMNKLAVDGYDWNNRPRDLANLTKWASREFEVSMNWQVVDLDDSRPEQWMDAPVLYLASHQPLELSQNQLERIKRYIDLGGTLVTVADGGDRSFTNSVRRTFEQLYPYRFQQVAADDPLFDIVYPLRGANVLALNNGVRHLVIHIPSDYSWIFQSEQQRDPTPWHLMGNIFQYAVERTQPRAKLERHLVEGTGGGGPAVHIGRARYDGNWDPEPLAWERLAAFATGEDKLTPVIHELDLADLGQAEVSMVHVVGAGAVEFTAEQVDAVRDFAQGGGVILFEAAGGDAAFTESVLQLLNRAFPDRRVRRLGGYADLITGNGLPGGYDNTRVDYRVFYKQKLGPAARPAFQAVLFDDQPRVLLSAEDLSQALLGQPVWGVFGYDTESARKLMINIALWSGLINPTDDAD